MAKKLLMGNEAFAHAALEAGVRVAAGYPGTPSSEVIETIAKLHAAGTARDVHVEWSTNEKAALELLAGAAYAGARCLFTCKQVGLNVASDALMSLNYVGVKGGLVLFVADDPGPISSQTEQDTRRFAAFAKLPVLDPSTPEEGFAMMKAAFDLSERYGTPVIVRPTTRICHASTFFEVVDVTDARPVPDEGFVRDSKWVIFPRRAWEAHGEINERLRLIARDFCEEPALAAFNVLAEVPEGGAAEACGEAEERAAVERTRAERARAAEETCGAEGRRAAARACGAERVPGAMDVSRETSIDEKAIREGGASRKDVAEKSGCESGAGEKVVGTARVGILAGGVSAAYAREALRMLEARAVAWGAENAETGGTARDAAVAGADAVTGSNAVCGNAAYDSAADGRAKDTATCAALPSYRFMQVGTPYPFPEDAVARFAEGLERVLVLEELDHVLEDGLLVLAGKGRAACEVRGRLTGDARDRGENDVDDIACRIARFFGMRELAFDASDVSRETSSAMSAETAAETMVATSAAVVAPSEIAASSATSAVPAASATPDLLAATAGSAAAVSPMAAAGSTAPASSVASAGSAAAATSAVHEAARAKDRSGAPALAPSDALAFDATLPLRPPVLCAGCPHRGSFYAVKRALGKTPAVLCGDIGCYTLGNAKPLDAVDTCLCMGAGITMAQGFAVAEPQKKHVAFVGDSTFFASGLTGVVNAVYNGHDITVCVLDNATTAMTGSQPHPGTGVTLMGPRRTPVSIRRVLEALGVECIVRADPLDRAGAEAAAREALAFEGPSAILFESPCVQLVRPGAPAQVDADACTGCKKCITEIGCPGIGFNADARGPKSKERGQAFVDASLCNGCGLCVQICPFNALEIPVSQTDVSRETSGEGVSDNSSVRRPSGKVAAEAESPAAADEIAAKRSAGNPSAAAEPSVEGGPCA